MANNFNNAMFIGRFQLIHPPLLQFDPSHPTPGHPQSDTWTVERAAAEGIRVLGHRGVHWRQAIQNLPPHAGLLFGTPHPTGDYRDDPTIISPNRPNATVKQKDWIPYPMPYPDPQFGGLVFLCRLYGADFDGLIVRMPWSAATQNRTVLQWNNLLRKAERRFRENRGLRLWRDLDQIHVRHHGVVAADVMRVVGMDLNALQLYFVMVWPITIRANGAFMTDPSNGMAHRLPPPPTDIDRRTHKLLEFLTAPIPTADGFARYAPWLTLLWLPVHYLQHWRIQPIFYQYPPVVQPSTYMSHFGTLLPFKYVGPTPAGFATPDLANSAAVIQLDAAVTAQNQQAVLVFPPP
ncbi:hypothetical protein EJ08DRAFT_703827 [Tothia fuscella]|uniref:Uncharacterized protein n=1 Tax=Tothia fuscella TaxID=1048955 RepID=A0A9P4TS53_9PEZI|nr:hypothetical protein EJ08DRAFT_703827 [Tothia fuscella]